MTELFWKIADLSFSASWIILAVIAARILLRKAPKWFLCGLWALVAIRLVCPFSLESDLSLVPDTRELPAKIQHALPTEPNAGEIVIAYADPAPVTETTQDKQGTSHIYMATPTFEKSANIVGPISSVWQPVLAYLGYIWLLGILLMVTYAAVTYLHICKKVTVSLEIEKNILLCDSLDTPFILGILYPKIYLPSDMTEEDTSYVLAHEQAHLHRRDHLWKPLGFLLLSIHWFNPLLWVAYILLCRDIELACDEHVVKNMNRLEKKAYAEALLNCSLPRHLITACPLAFGEVGIKQRVQSVLHYKKPGFWILLASILIAGLLAVCFLTDPYKDTLSDFYQGDRKDVTCVDLMTDKGHVCLNAPAELDAVWELLETVEYDPHPHTTETEWDTMIDDFYAYHELEWNMGEELRYLYFYRDFSSVCVEDEEGCLNHYSVTNPNMLTAFFTSRIDLFRWHEVTAEPFATVEQPYQWMQGVTLDAIQDINTSHSLSANEVKGSRISPIRAEKLLEIIHAIPEDALSNPETIGPGGVDQVTSFLTNNPNFTITIQDGANDLGVVFRYYVEADVSHLEIAMVEGAANVGNLTRNIKSAMKWDLESEELLEYMQELIAHPSSVTAFVGAEYDWQEERPKVSGNGASIDLRLIDGWQSEIVPYTEGCESFGIRIRPPKVTSGWLYFSFWPGGYFPEEVNRCYYPSGHWNYEGYTSYPLTHEWHYGYISDFPDWTYTCFPTNIGDYTIINEGAEIWSVMYGDQIRDITTFLRMEGGIQENFKIPEATIVPVEYSQSSNAMQGYKRFLMETPDPAGLTINSAWVYDDTIQEEEDHIHFGAFWPEYVTEGRVCIEYWEGGFQPDAELLVEEMTFINYNNSCEAYSGKLSGEAHWRYVWINREHGSYVFRFEDTQDWTDFQVQCVFDHVISEISFRKQ